MQDNQQWGSAWQAVFANYPVDGGNVAVREFKHLAPHLEPAPEGPRHQRVDRLCVAISQPARRQELAANDTRVEIVIIVIGHTDVFRGRGVGVAEKDKKMAPRLRRGPAVGFSPLQALQRGAGEHIPVADIKLGHPRPYCQGKMGPETADPALSGYLPIRSDLRAEVAADRLFYLLEQLIWLLDIGRERLFEITCQESGRAGPVSPDDMRQEGFAHNRVALLFLLADDLQQDRTRNLGAGFLVEDRKVDLTDNQVADITQRDVPAFFGVVESTIGVFLDNADHRTLTLADFSAQP